MLKQKKEFRINFLTVNIVSLICLIIGGFGIFLGIYKFNQLNIAHAYFLLCMSIIPCCLSLILLIAHNIVYIENRKEMTYMQYNKIKFNPKSDILKITLLNSILIIIAIILIILALVF